ncbi:MAG: hypothetical protein CUN55_07185 [Phototrophicales bacterium]|nr:MAG: hypothetical protein CUN55_07185 [Phototrophicales bacterium]
MNRRTFLLGRSSLPQITPIEQFFIPYDVSPPNVSTTSWSLHMGGLVQQPNTFSYQELVSLPQSERIQTLMSIANPTGGRFFGTARWEGIPFNYLLDKLHVSSKARYANIYSADGRMVRIELEFLSHAQTLLALKMNRETLSSEHGYPARLIVPFVYDYKMPKWITRIEFTDSYEQDDWERLGWSPRGIVQTHAIILSPHHQARIASRTIQIEGIAFAGGRRITKVEVNINERGWMPTLLYPASYPFAAIKWSVEWQPPIAGSYQIAVRATDERGFTQYLRQQHPKPDGSQAIHHIVVHVIETAL